MVSANQSSHIMYCPLSPFANASYNPVSPHGSDAGYNPVSPHGSDAGYNPVSPQGSDAGYNPVSPHGSDAGYKPISPKASNKESWYCPESPKAVTSSPARRIEYIDEKHTVSSCGHIRPRRRIIHGGHTGSTGTIEPGTFLHKILNPPKVTYKDKPFVPVDNWRSYLRTMKIAHERNLESIMNCILKTQVPETKKKLIDEYNRTNNRMKANMAEIREKHEEWERTHTPPPPPPPKEVINVPSDPCHVFVTTKVGKDGKVKVSMNAPMAGIYEKYFSKGTRPPIKEYLKALKQFGYPDSVLEKVLLNHIDRPKKQKELDAAFERIFSKYNTKSKPSKPKKLPVSDRIKKIMKDW